ncbi:MAG TPA: uL30 family ribosomal protein [Nitrososphaerales archaeon]|nr:uL30 family ribosomal protein [Nitrososphaerales archaeon]
MIVLALLVVLNLHGAINAPAPVRSALEELKLEKRFSASVVPDDPSTLGALRLCKDRLAWAPIDEELLTTLLTKRGMVSTTKALDQHALKEMGYKDHGELATMMLKNGIRLSAVEGLRPFFKLAPPKGGFKHSMRKSRSEGGVMGSNPELLDLVRRMV